MFIAVGEPEARFHFLVYAAFHSSSVSTLDGVPPYFAGPSSLSSVIVVSSCSSNCVASNCSFDGFARAALALAWDSLRRRSCSALSNCLVLSSSSSLSVSR